MVITRFEGARVFQSSGAATDFLPKDNLNKLGEYMDESEVVTRMLHVLHQFGEWDLNSIVWDKPFDAQGFDSLDATAFLTSFEHEFHTIFEDNVFESFETFNDVKKHLVKDHNAF